MDEQSFIDRLSESPGDISLLREFAKWLSAHNDIRGQHLVAELDVYDAELALAQADTQLSDYRRNRSQDFQWLNSVLPMITKAPLDGIFYSSLTCISHSVICLGIEEENPERSCWAGDLPRLDGDVWVVFGLGWPFA